jgi:hypothetical protein
MTKAFRKGDRVAWPTPQGETSGTVERVVTAPMDIKHHRVAASKESPEVLVRSISSGELAAHKPETLRRL